MLNQCFAYYKFEILQVFGKIYLQNDITYSQKPRKTAARDVVTLSSLKNFSFPPMKSFVMIADHTYIDYNNPEISRQFNNVAVFTVKRNLC